jgi:hypothetical protein
MSKGHYSILLYSFDTLAGTKLPLELSGKYLSMQAILSAN